MLSSMAMNSSLDKSGRGLDFEPENRLAFMKNSIKKNKPILIVETLFKYIHVMSLLYNNEIYRPTLAKTYLIVSPMS